MPDDLPEPDYDDFRLRQPDPSFLGDCERAAKGYPLNADYLDRGRGIEPAVTNRDNGHLGACPLPEVSGPGAREISAFVPTQHELTILVKYWMKEVIRVAYLEFATGCGDSTNWDWQLFSQRRIRRIASCIGQTAVREIIADVYHEWGEQNGHSRMWQAFLTGNKSEQRAAQEERWATLESAQPAEPRRMPNVQEMIDLYDDFMLFLTGRPHDLRSRRVDMDSMEELRRRCVREEPSLLQPHRRRELVSDLLLESGYPWAETGKYVAQHVTASGEFIVPAEHVPVQDGDSPAAVEDASTSEQRKQPV
jgi:hypothetical protein